MSLGLSNWLNTGTLLMHRGLEEEQGQWENKKLCFGNSVFEMSNRHPSRILHKSTQFSHLWKVLSLKYLSQRYL